MSFRPNALCICLGVVFLVVSWAGVATAADGDSPVYYSGGQAYSLIRSDTEFAVEMEDGESLGSVSPRSLRAVGGVIKPVPWGRSNGRFAILEVPVATRDARRAARTMSGVRSLHHVYRFTAAAQPILGTGELVAQLSEGMTPAQRDAFFSEYGVEIVGPIDGMRDWYVLRPADPDGDEVAIAAAMYEDGRTVYAHPNFRSPRQLRQSTPQDEYFDRQWHLNNTGQGGGTAGADINVLDAWTETQGEDVLVGMFDDSCDVFHEDLRANYSNVSHDVVSGEESTGAANPRDIGDRHGTCVMGLICAAPNANGVRGAAPLAQFTASRAGNAFIATYAQIALAYTFARQQGVDVHNNSWGEEGSPNPDEIVDAIRTAFDEGRNGLGMVVLFASGNSGMEVNLGFELSTLSTVIGVGASNASDSLATYSNYGDDIDVVAPSGDDFLPGMVTTDNSDDAGFAEPGYNNGGFDDFGDPNLPNPDYTQDFGGTSAACPVAAGVAALILSANPELTATQVRAVLEHTADKISPDDAEYQAITSRSLKYGYGRINAAAAVQAAVASRDNGGLTWPERVTNIRVSNNTLQWDPNDDLRGDDERGDKTTAYLVIEKSGTGFADFAWLPSDGASYDDGETVGDGATVVLTGDDEEYAFDAGETRYFAIFARNSIGRYSWGVAADSDGNIINPGAINPGAGGGGGDGVFVPPGAEIPKVSIAVTPLNGQSPLSVSFRGNAQTDSEIASAEWDFGDGTTDTNRTTTHTYTVTSGASESFKATFTVEDSEGDVGSRAIIVNVTATAGDGGDGGTSGGKPAIIVEDAETGATGVDTGEAPFSVRFTVDVSDVPGTLSSVQWDLGDGTQAFALSVPHTYTIPGVFPVTVTVTTVTSSGATITSTSPALLITVTGQAATNENDNTSGTVTGSGTSQSGGLCGTGMLIPFVGLVAMAALRRRLS